MSRIPTLSGIADAPAAAQPLLRVVEKRLGRVPNVLRVMANSPATLRGFLAFRRALTKGSLSAATRERITLAVAETNGCDYCLSAGIFRGRQNKRDDAELTANRNGASNDMREDAAMRLAAKILATRGHVSDADIADFKAAGYSDSELVELVAQVALTTFTNYLNEVAGTAIDFPVIHHRAIASKAVRDLT